LCRRNDGSSIGGNRGEGPILAAPDEKIEQQIPCWLPEQLRPEFGISQSAQSIEAACRFNCT